ncbi:MAG: hypothetical protein GC153_06230 [Alphaproteobacteria bacterium]|nr:hypothetical protein [Alphaproteobacteria bacterium]
MTAAWQAGRRFLLGAGSFALAPALPVLVVFAHRGVAPLLLVMAIVAASLAGPWRGIAALFAPPASFKKPGAVAAWALAAFCAWIGAAGLWSPIAGASGLALDVAAPALAGYFAVAGVFARDADARAHLAKAFAASCLLALALLTFEAASGGYLRLIMPPADHSPGRIRDFTSLGRGMTALLPGLFAVCGMIALAGMRAQKRRKAAAVGLAAIALVALFAAARLTISSNVAAIIAGAAAAVIAFSLRRGVVAGLTFLYVGALASAPALALTPARALAARWAGAAPDSWLQRLFIWRRAAREALACLPFGCGADYARALSEKGETVTISGAAAPLALTPIHPHNVFLQIWLELGLPGVALAALFIFASGRALADARPGRATRAAIAGAAAATLVSFLDEASLWQVWRLAAIGLGAVGLALLRGFESDSAFKTGASA